MKISIIVPVLDEERQIGARLRELAAWGDVVIVDGGSSDATCAMIRAAGFPQLIESERGRARQLNAGARAAQGDVLLFLHADCALPEDAAGQVERALRDPGTVAGAFRTWHLADDGRFAPWLHLADLRSRYTGLPYGDQALFVRRKVFEEVGGFPEQPLMEDLELSRRLSARGRIVTVPARVRVSGRRFLRHPLRESFLVNVFPLLYRLGVSPEKLARLYQDIR